MPMRAGFIGLSSRDRFPELVRSVVEGLGMATRDCYAAMGEMPAELRITGGAARRRRCAARFRRRSMRRCAFRPARKRALPVPL